MNLQEGLKIYQVPIDQIKLNKNNPRIIEDKEFNSLVESVKNDGFMFPLRFLVVDKENVVMGGNQRLRACQVAKLSHVYVVKAEDLSEAQLKEFVVQDNTYYGEWDKPILAEFYSDKELVEVGLPLVEVSVPRMETIGDIEPEIDESDLADRKATFENNQIKQIVVYFPLDIYEKVIASIESVKIHMECQENPEVLLNLISYWKRNHAA